MTEGASRGGARGPGGPRKARPAKPATGRRKQGTRGRTGSKQKEKDRAKPKQVQNPPRDRMGSPGTRTRKLAADLVRRIDEDGAYANIAVPAALDASELPVRDRALVTELVYGTTRRRRTCDWLVDRYTSTDPDPVVRSFLRIGAYQLAFTDIPDYAAVSATVAATPVKVRPFVNAVLRKLVKESTPAWPDDGVRLSYPDWLIDRLRADLGAERADEALAVMNEPPPVSTRPDGYVQDVASQWVASTVGAQSGDRVLDLCAAPGGKATAIATSGAHVVALDARVHRAYLIDENARRLELADRVHTLAADARRMPLVASARFDRVLLDAPCSGLGALRRRPDARWRIEQPDVDELARLQKELLRSAMTVLAPGGLLVYSVCTMTRAETTDIDDWLAREHPTWLPAGLSPSPGGTPSATDATDPAGDVEAVSSPWEPAGRGHLLLPQRADTDGMYLLAVRGPG